MKKLSLTKEDINKIKKMAQEVAVEAPVLEMLQEYVGIDKMESMEDCVELDEMPSEDTTKEISDSLHGLPMTSSSFRELLKPICKYALTSIIQNDEKPIYFTGVAFGSGPKDEEIQVDVNKTGTVYNNITAVYADKIIQAHEDDWGTYHVHCFAKNKKASKDYMASLNARMFTDNQYRGKCLFFNGESIDFRETPAVDWDNVILPEATKKKILLNTASFLTNDKFRKSNLNQRGLILHGPPGTGKTMMVKSIFNKLSGGDVTRVYTTSGSFPYQSSVDDLFDFLRFTGGTMLAFEDMDLISPDRGDSSSRKILGSLLNNLDGIRKIEDPLVVVGTTNDVEMLDVALANRPSRFDRKIEIGRPKPEEIKKFYSSLLGFNVSDDLIQASVGFCGAHIQEVVNTAKMISIDTGGTIEDSLTTACSEVQENFFPMMKESSTIDDQIRKTAQGLILQFPPDTDLNGIDMYTLLPQILPYLGLGFKKEHDVTDAEATAMWKMWNEQSDNVKDNVMAHSLEQDILSSLQDKKIISTVDNGHVSLTDKGKKVLRSLILSMEKNTFENIPEADAISMDEVDRIIHNAGSTKKKVASKQIDRKENITEDYYFNHIQHLIKDDN